MPLLPPFAPLTAACRAAEPLSDDRSRPCLLNAVFNLVCAYCLVHLGFVGEGYLALIVAVRNTGSRNKVPRAETSMQSQARRLASCDFQSQ